MTAVASSTTTTNWFDPSMPSDVRSQAQKIINELSLTQAFLRVRYNDRLKQITFTQDRRVVDVPLVLIDKGAWSDIRFLFRAVLDAAPSQWNLSADSNDWSAFATHTYKPEN